MFKFLTALFIFLLSLGSTWAQSASQLNAQLGAGDKKVKHWGLSVSSTTVSSIKELSTYGSTLNTSLSSTFRYKTRYFNTRFYIGANKDLVGARKGSLGASFFEISKNVGFLSSKKITTIFQGRYNFAVNQYKRNNTSYRGGVSAGLLIISQTPSPYLTAIFISRAVKNFHQYKIARDYSKNTSISNINTAIVSYAPFSFWEFSFYSSFVSSWNYYGGVNDSYYTLGETISYSPSRQYNFTLGHESGGYTYGYYGNSLDLSLLDTKSSSVYGTLTVNF